jgi:hypothetical protein
MENGDPTATGGGTNARIDVEFNSAWSLEKRVLSRYNKSTTRY